MSPSGLQPERFLYVIAMVYVGGLREGGEALFPPRRCTAAHLRAEEGAEKLYDSLVSLYHMWGTTAV